MRKQEGRRQARRKQAGRRQATLKDPEMTKTERRQVMRQTITILTRRQAESR